MSDQVHKAVNYTCVAGVNTGDVISSITDDALHNDTWHLASTGGSIEVEVSLDGTNYLASKIALLDGTSTTPSTMVVATTAGKFASFRGKFRAIRLKQIGATAVANPAFIGYRTT